MATLITDTFDRSNNADLGASWDGYTGSNPFAINSNAARPSAFAADNIETYNAVTPPDDQWAEIVLGTWAGNSNYRNLHALCRFAAPNTISGYSGAVETPNPAGKVFIGEFVAGSFSVLASSPQTVVSGDVIRLQVIGSNLELFQNGVSRTSASDGTRTSGRVGIASYPDIAITDADIASFQAGDFLGFQSSWARGSNILIGA